MKKEIEYTDGPLGKLRAIEDLLPSPEDLILKADTTKVTLRLSVDSVEFFKSYAEQNHASYQNMIRNLLDFYVMKKKQDITSGQAFNELLDKPGNIPARQHHNH